MTTHTNNYNNNTIEQTGPTDTKTSIVGNNNNYVTITHNNNPNITISNMQEQTSDPEMEIEHPLQQNQQLTDTNY